MCAIFGYYKLKPDASASPVFIDTALKLMEHRGPDAHGTASYSDGRILMGHRRLSIIDTREVSNQPMETTDSTICFNGEIYNYQELVHDRLAHLQFKTKSDTEVLQRGIDTHGTGFLNELNGMFSFAHLDRNTNKLLLVRDRFGVKPLHYMVQDDVLYYASEIESLIRIKRNACINSAIYDSYLRDTATDYDDQTFVQDIFQVPAGEYLVCDGTTITRTRWYHGQDFIFSPDVMKNTETRVSFLEDLLTDAIDKRLRADVPIALTLSGGLDSTVIYTLIKERLNRNVSAFTFTHPGSATDEHELVQELVGRYGDTVTPITSRLEETPQRMTDTLDLLEFPTWNPSSIAYLDTYHEIHERGFKVVIEGHGSDEQLGGYSYMVQSAMYEALKRGNLIAARERYQVLKGTDNSALGQTGRTLKLRSVLSEIAHASRPSNSFRICADRAWNYAILPIVLRTFDRLTMGESLESRCPFMDYRVVEFIRTLPTSDLVNSIGSKAPLRMILKKYGQDRIYKNRAKMGFSGDLRKLYDDTRFIDTIRTLVSSLEIPQYQKEKRRALDALEKGRSSEYPFAWKLAALSYITKHHGLTS